jgi:hypothetical protein
MNRDMAEKLMAALHDLNGPLNEIFALVEEIADEDEKRAMRRAFGQISGQLFTDAMFPIITQYPDLDPDTDTEWYRKAMERRAHKEGSCDDDS